METLTISDKSNELRSLAPGRADDGDAFGIVLADVQASQLAGATQLFVAPSGLEARDQGEQGKQESARRTRVAQETQDARLAETNARDARRAEAATADRDTASSRRARVLESKSEPAAPQQNAERGGSSRTTGMKETGTASPSRPANVEVKTDTKPSTAQTSPQSTRQTGEALGSTKPAGQTEPPAQNDGARTASANTVTVSTAGAARTRSAGDPQAADTAARSVGRLLAGKGAVDSVKTQSPVIGGGEVRENAGADRKSNSARATQEGERNAGETKGKESPGNARRAEFHRLVQQVRMNAGTRTSSATIRLDPPELGKVRVDVRMVDDVLHVRVEAASSHARELLGSRADELTAALREHDIEVRRLEVVGANDANDDVRSHEDPSQDDGSQRGALMSGEDGANGAWQDSAGRMQTGVHSEDGDATTEIESPRETIAQDARLDVRV